VRDGLITNTRARVAIIVLNAEAQGSSRR
jgi:hypothetical protein